MSDLTSPIQIGDYTPDHLLVDDGKTLKAISGLFSSATISSLEEEYGPFVGAYASGDMIVLLLKNPYLDIEDLARGEDEA